MPVPRFARESRFFCLSSFLANQIRVPMKSEFPGAEFVLVEAEKYPLAGEGDAF